MMFDRHRMRAFWAGITILTTGWGAVAQGNDANAQKYLFNYQFRANQTLSYEARHNSVITTRKGDVSQVSENDLTTRKHFRVISVDSSSNAILESFIDQLKSRVRFDREDPVVYDSTLGKAPPRQLKGVSDILGKPLMHLQVTQSGEMIKAVPQRALAGAGGTQGPTEDVSHNFIVTFPKQAIAVGESWQDDYEVKVGLGPKLKRTVQIKRKYTLTSVENNIATLQLRSVVITPIRDPQIKIQLIQRTPEGSISFDLERGLVLAKTLAINNTEYGFSGDDSSMKVESVYTEKLLDIPGPTIQQTSAEKPSAPKTDTPKTD